MASPYYGPWGTRRVEQSAFGRPGDLWWGKDFLDSEETGRAGYQAFRDAIGGSANFQQFLGNDFGRARDQWMAEGAGKENPARWTDWLLGRQDKIVQDYARLTPYQRGENPRKVGRLRWL